MEKIDRLGYLNKRYGTVVSELKSLSSDSRFVHRCGNHLLLLGSNMRRASAGEVSLDALETVIVEAEDYVLKIAQQLYGRNID